MLFFVYADRATFNEDAIGFLPIDVAIFAREKTLVVSMRSFVFVPRYRMESVHTVSVPPARYNFAVFRPNCCANNNLHTVFLLGERGDCGVVRTRSFPFRFG